MIEGSAVLSGSIHLADDATIALGVEIAIEAGSSFRSAAGKILTVQGALVIDGTADATVSMIPDPGASSWGGIAVDAGGSAAIRYVTGTEVDALMTCRAGALACELERIDFEDVGTIIRAASAASLVESRVSGMANGAVHVASGGDLTVSDTELSQSSHDLVTASGGHLTIEHTTIGGTIDTYEHCNLHIGSADSLTITRSNIVTGVYGIMIGNVNSARINYNNWEGNTNDVSPMGSPTDADFTHNYWGKGSAPSLGGEYDFTSLEPDRVADAGPRI